jgi:hypothetical protein
MRTWCYLVAAILAAHAGAAFAGSYLRVTGPPPLRFQPQTVPVSTAGDATNATQQALIADEGGQPCPTNAPVGVAAPVANSSVTVAVESGLATQNPAQDQPSDEQPITSQVLAEIFRHTAGPCTNQSTTVVLPPGFMPPQPAAPRSSSATYTDH